MDALSPDPMVQRIVDHLMAAQVALLTAGGDDPNNTVLAEAQSFVWKAICTLTRITPLENLSSPSDQPPHLVAPQSGRLI